MPTEFKFICSTNEEWIRTIQVATMTNVFWIPFAYICGNLSFNFGVSTIAKWKRRWRRYRGIERTTFTAHLSFVSIFTTSNALAKVPVPNSLRILSETKRKQEISHLFPMISPFPPRKWPIESSLSLSSLYDLWELFWLYEWPSRCRLIARWLK